MTFVGVLRATASKLQDFFKLKKICTGESYVSAIFLNMGMQGIDSRPFVIDAYRT